MKSVYKITEYRYGLDLDDIKVGDKYILVERTNINTGTTEYRLCKDNGQGIGGNTNYDIKMYHGWRGTTNNISVYAEGLRRVERVDAVKTAIDGITRTVKVKLSADLVEDRP